MWPEMTKRAKSGLNHRFKEGLKMQFGYHILECCRFKTEQTCYTAIQLKDRSRDQEKKKGQKTNPDRTAV